MEVGFATDGKGQGRVLTSPKLKLVSSNRVRDNQTVLEVLIFIISDVRVNHYLYLCTSEPHLQKKEKYATLILKNI